MARLPLMVGSPLWPDAAALLDNIPRIATLSPGQLDRSHLQTARPVILTDLVTGSLLSDLADPERARAELADLPVPVIPPPVQRLVRGRGPDEPRWVTFGAFYDYLVSGRGPSLVCAEHSLPDVLARRLPEVPHLQLGSSADVVGADMFMSGAGGVTHLHVDRTLRPTLITQVFGRKRYVVIDASQTSKLTLGSPPKALYASALFLDHFTAGELEGFLRYTSAWECVLEPGETLVVPATAWHYVAYLDTALSVHLRLARPHHVLQLAQLAAEVNTFSPELLALARHLLDGDGPAESAARVLAGLSGAVDRARELGGDEVAAFQRACLEQCGQLGLAASRPPLHIADLQRRREVLGRAS